MAAGMDSRASVDLISLAIARADQVSQAEAGATPPREDMTMKRAFLAIIVLSLVVPFDAGTATAARANDEATIYRDEYGIPHVFAETLEYGVVCHRLCATKTAWKNSSRTYRRATRHDRPKCSADFYRSDFIQRMWRHESISRGNTTRSAQRCALASRLIRTASSSS